MSFNDVETEVEAVRAGIGIGQLPAYMIHADLASGRLKAILPGYSSSNVGMYMYYPHRSQMPVRVRRFIDFVVEAARGAEQSLSRLVGIVA